MKYKAIVDTSEFKDFKFFEDEIGPYMVAKDANACADNSGWIPLYFKEVEKESEDVLAKVRAEIEQLRLHKAQFITSDNKICIDSQEVLNIIDKYIGKDRKSKNDVLDEIKALISCSIVEDDTSGNTPARLRADWDAANKAHMKDIAIIDRYRTNSEEITKH